MSPPTRKSRPAVNGAALDQPGGPRPTLPDPRDDAARHGHGVQSVETTMHDVIAHALAPVVVPGGGRRSLPDSYQCRVRKVLAAVESLERVHADARFPGELREIQRRHLPVVVNHAAAKLNDLRDVLASDRAGSS